MAGKKAPETKQREIVLVLGKTGKGKSTWMKHYVWDCKRCIILDPLGEYPGDEYDSPVDMLDDIAGRESFRVRSCNIMDFPYLCRVAYAVGNVSLIIEESQRSMPQSGQGLPVEAGDIIYRGRHPNVSFLMVAQRPTTIHIAPRSQWTRIVSFNQTEDADVRWLESTTGFDLTEIRRFGIGEYYEISPSGLERKKTTPFVHREQTEERGNLSFLSVVNSSRD